MATQREMNEWLTANGPNLIASQNAYKARHGRHVQRLRGGAMPSDRTRNDETAEERMRFDGLHASASFTDYVGPDGAGFDLVMYATDAGVNSRRVIHRGPETRREMAWTEIE